MTIKAVLAAAVVALVTSTASTFCQTLGDVAKKEEARRKTVKTPGKVYTNESLHAEGEPPPPPATDASPTPATPAPAASGAQPPAADAAKKDEAYWKDRLAQARTALNRASRSFQYASSFLAASAAGGCARCRMRPELVSRGWATRRSLRGGGGSPSAVQTLVGVHLPGRLHRFAARLFFLGDITEGLGRSGRGARHERDNSGREHSFDGHILHSPGIPNGRQEPAAAGAVVAGWSSARCAFTFSASGACGSSSR